jgi:hypothetical protein
MRQQVKTKSTPRYGPEEVNTTQQVHQQVNTVGQDGVQ